MGLVEGKTCIVTGGAGSIGLATVRALLAEGAKVMLVDLDADKLARTVRELGTDKAAFVAADVTDAAQTRKYVDETVARWGKIDVLFSNAGNDGPLMPITEYPEDLFDKHHRHARPRLLPGLQIYHSADERRRQHHHHREHRRGEGRARQLLVCRGQTRADGPDALCRQGGRGAAHSRQQRQSRTGRQSVSCARPRKR